jgi:hypothetical protein
MRVAAGDRSLAFDGGLVAAQAEFFEAIRWGPTHWLVEKWSEEACSFVRRKLALDAQKQIPSALLRKLIGEAEETEEAIGNILLNAGIQRMEDVLLGVVTTNLFTNGNSRLGVGDSTTAEAASQTDLQAATNKTYVAMNATYPSRSGQVVSFQADFGTAVANYAWQEFITDNGATNRACLNRKVTSLGTKASGTWTLTETITLS